MEFPTSCPAITAVVCTYNRANLLGRALESLAGQAMPCAEREIIVVDDGSTDDTPAVSARFAQAVPGLRVIRQPNAGLGAARNAGWRAARTHLVAFLDDDAVAPPGWMEEIVRGFEVADDRLGVIGGPIDPDWESPPPDWISRDLAGWLGQFDLGPVPLESRQRTLFAGGNMAFRTAALQDVNGFPEHLGRRGPTLLSHEESELWARLAERDWSNAYLPGLRVRHFTPRARMTPAWFRRRLFWEGISVARREAWPRELTAPRRLRRWLGYGVATIGRRDFLQTFLRPFRWRRDLRWQTYCAYHGGYLREMFRRLV
ncbi:MAG: hypothetical protein RIR76_1779 [Verrucomicrobiota bacterium]|jgi:GT2 family glycosyltransferase